MSTLWDLNEHIVRTRWDLNEHIVRTRWDVPLGSAEMASELYNTHSFARLVVIA